MELKWLEDFVALASTGSFSRAAEIRNVTQSAFSRRIKQLETWLGADLVSRATLPAELTPEGISFLPVAQSAIRTMQEARAATQAARPQARPVLNIAALQTLTVTRLPRWLEQLEQHLPTARTRLIPDRGGIEANLDALVDGEADLLLTYAHPYVPMLLDPRQFDWITLDRDIILPVMAPEPGRKGSMTCDAVRAVFAGTAQQDIPYLDYGNASFFGTALQRLFARRVLPRRIMHENAMCIGLRALALEGRGICWLPQSLIAGDLKAGRLVTVSSDPQWQLEIDIRLYRCRAPRHQTGVTDRLWDRLQGAAISDSHAGRRG